MFGLEAWQVRIKKQERQITDLWVAGKLWDLYEADTGEGGIFPLLQDICAIGAEISILNLRIAEAALKETANDETGVKKGEGKGSGNLSDSLNKWRRDKIQRRVNQVVQNQINLSTPISSTAEITKDGLSLLIGIGFFGKAEKAFSFLDCFYDKGGASLLSSAEAFLKTLEAMKTSPKTYFTDMGKIGGYLRFHAELAEKLCECISDHLQIKSHDKYLSLKHGGDGSTPHKALYSVLSREYKGRLVYQSKFTRQEIKNRKDYKNSTTYKKPSSPFSTIFSKRNDNERNTYKKEDRKSYDDAHQRQRESVKGATIPEHLRPFIKVPSHCVKLDRDKKAYIDFKWESGITRWKQNKHDRMRIISELYGLPPGATISGTTTDHMFAIYEIMTYCKEKATGETGTVGRYSSTGNKMEMNLPFLHLVPLIQMVPQMHHSLAETAVALSLNGFISYHVGYYTSLFPSRVDKEPYLQHLRKGLNSRLAAEIRILLKQADAYVCHMYAKPEPKSSPPVSTGTHRENGYGYAVNKSDLSEWKEHYDKALLDAETLDKFHENSFYERIRNDQQSSIKLPWRK